MAVVKMHKASDGSLHENFEAFATHEAKLKMTPQLEDLVMANGSLLGVVVDEDVANITEFLIANADKLRGILNGSVIAKRGRKQAAPAAA